MYSYVLFTCKKGVPNLVVINFEHINIQILCKYICSNYDHDIIYSSN